MRHGCAVRLRQGWSLRPPVCLNRRNVDQLAQLLKGTAGLALHGPDPDPQRVGSLLFGQVMPEPEHHHRALPVRQGADRADQLIPVVVHTDNVGSGHLGEGQPRSFTPGSPATLIPAQIDHYLPGVCERVVDPAPPYVQPFQRGLRHLLADIRVACQGASQPDKSRPVGTHK